MNMFGSSSCRRHLAIFIFLPVSLLFCCSAFAQSSGDYRSNVAPSGNWNSSASWEKYNGVSWVAATDYPGQNAGAGTVTIRDGDAITLNVSPANAIGALTVGEGTSGTLTTSNSNWTLSITNNLTVASGASFDLNRLAITVNGNTSVSGTLSDGNNNGSATFVGSFTVNSGGTFSTSNSSSFTFRGGITNNGTFNKTGTGGVTFSTNNQTIGGSSSITMAGVVTVTGITVTNNNADLNLTSTAANALTGTGGWTQGTGSVMKFSGASMNIATVDFNTNSNTVDYARGGTQTVLSATYKNLTVSNSGTKTLGGNVTVNGNLDISGSATLACDAYQITGNATGTFTMASGTSLTLGNTASSVNVLFPSNFTSANISLNSASTVTYQNNSTQTVSGTPAYGNLTIATGGTKTIDGNVTINGNLTVNAGTFDFGSSAARTVTVAGDLSGAGAIDMSGGSLLHSLTLSGANNSITTFTTAAVASTVTYNGTSNQQVFASANYRNLVITENSTKTLQGATTVNNNLTISNSATLNPASHNLTVSGNTTISATFSDNSATGTTSLQDVDLSGGTITGTATGVVNINGNLTMPTGDGTIGRVTLTVSGTTTVATGRSFTINNNTGVKRFDGLVTISGTGTWTSTTVTTTANLELRGGIDVASSSGSFSAGAATFSTNNQNIAGAGTLTFANAVTVSGAITITNQNTNGVTFNNTITGTVAGSTWKNDVNAVTYYQPSATTQPMNTGTLDVSASGNYFHYSRAGNQNVKVPASSYYHLTISGGSSGVKTLQGATSVDGNLSIAASTSLDPSGQNLTVSGTSTIAGTLADGNASGTTSLQDVDLSGGTINGAATGVVNINGNLTMPTGNGTIGRMTLTVTGTTTVATGRSLTLNSNTGVKRFDSAITINGSGSWTSTTITTASNLDIRGGIEVASASGSFSASAATFSTNNQNITGAGPLSFDNGVTISGNITVTNTNTSGVTFNSTVDGTAASSTWKHGANGVTYYQPAAATQPMNTGELDVSASGNYFYYSRAGAQNIKIPLTSYFHLYITGGSSSTKTLQATTTVSGNLYVASSTTLSLSSYGLTVTGSTTLDGSISDANDAGTNTFTGLLTIGSTGSLSTSSNSPFVFEGGITNNGTFSKTGTGAVSFNTNDQDIDGTAAMTLAGAITIAAGKTVTYKNTNSTGITISGVLDGANSSSTWKNNANTTVSYAPGVSTRPMNTGILDVSASGNTFKYTDAGAQTIKTPASAYHNLSLSGTGTKSLSGETTVNGNLSLSSTTLDVVSGQNYAITVKGNWVNTSSTFLARNGTVTFSGSADQQITSNASSFYNVVININSPGTQLTLNDDLEITNLLTLTDGVITTGTSKVYINNNSSTSMGGYSSASFINGNLRRRITTNTDTYVFPVGDGTATTDYYRADVLNNGLTGIAYIDCKFKPLSNHDDADLIAANVADHWEHGFLGYFTINTAGVWELTPDNNPPTGGNYGVKLYIENMTGFTDNNFGPLKRPVGGDGSTWDTGGGTLNNSDSPGRTVSSGYMQRNGITDGFSEFGGGGGSGAGSGLPIELVRFTARALDDNTIHLDWQTATETNNDYFSVERSKDGDLFETIATVEAAGNSSVPIEYSVIDAQPHNGISYYRLRQTDMDSKYSFSDIVTVEIQPEEIPFSLYPNPVKGRKINVSATGGICSSKCVVEMLDMSGRKINLTPDEIFNSEHASILLPDNIRPGMYLIKLNDGTSTFRKKILAE